MPPLVRASERPSHPITRLSSERSTWVCVWSISCGNITLKLPQNNAGYTIAFSYTEPLDERFEPAFIDACLRTGPGVPDRVQFDRRSRPEANTQSPRAGHGPNRELGTGTAPRRVAAGRHRLRVPGRRRHHAHDRDLFQALRESADRAGPHP